jgi:hypothetical protein
VVRIHHGEPKPSKLRTFPLVDDTEGGFSYFGVASSVSRICPSRRAVIVTFSTRAGSDALFSASVHSSQITLKCRLKCLFQAIKRRSFHREETRVCLPHRLTALISLLTSGYLSYVSAGNQSPEHYYHPSFGNGLRQRGRNRESFSAISPRWIADSSQSA